MYSMKILSKLFKTSQKPPKEPKFNKINLKMSPQLDFKKIFLNKHIEFNMPNNPSCAIVGNSGILNEKEYGDLIDSHDIIIRCNLGPTKTFEKHTGKKTSFRIINSHVFSCGKHTPFENKYTINDFPNETLLVKKWDEQLFRKSVLNLINKNKLYFFNPSFIDKFCSQELHSSPTCGYIGVMLALQFSKNISLFGFSFFKDSWETKHYYEKIKPYKLKHDLTNEEKIITYLHEKKLLNIHY